MKTNTACALAPELSDAQLLAYLDGQADPNVSAHLERCPYCLQRANYLASFQNRMTTLLYRLTCPSASELGEYYLGILPGVKEEAVRRHLVECPHCSQEVSLLKDYMSELKPDLEFGLVERVKVLVAQLVESRKPGDGLGSLVLAPVGAGVRGGLEGTRLYQADNIQVTFETQEDPQSPGSQVLLGLLIGIDPMGFQAHLWQADKKLATVNVDELGNFILPGLDPGQYELILSGPETEIHIQSLSL